MLAKCHCARLRSKLTLLLCLFISPLFLFANDASWNESVEALKSSRFEEASDKLSHWIADKAKEHTFSSEAHYNLFLAQIGLEASGPAVAHLLRSIQLEKNPLKNLESKATLCELQNRYGIKEGLCQSYLFTLALVTGKNFLLLLSMLLVWGIFFSLVFRKKNKELSMGLALFAAVLGVVDLTLYLSSQSHASLYVLSGTDKNISIYKTPECKEDEKLVDLAAGTLVEVTGSIKDNKRQISQPIAGWVPENNLIPVDTSLSLNPVVKSSL